MKRALVGVVTLVAAPVLGADHDAAETALKRFFEGRPVVVRLDMPATSSGIDVYPEREDPLEFGKVADRLRSSGTALHEGDRITVTLVKVKDDLIEFQLGGGGFNSFKDGSGTASVPYTSQARRERDLERRLTEGTDSRRRRAPQRELDALRRARGRRGGPQGDDPRAGGVDLGPAPPGGREPGGGPAGAGGQLPPGSGPRGGHVRRRRRGEGVAPRASVS